jgi:hypothetical protein
MKLSDAVGYSHRCGRRGNRTDHRQRGGDAAGGGGADSEAGGTDRDPT